MSDNLSKNTEITQQACAWIAQLESESMKSDDLIAFKEWVERSPAHKNELDRLALFSSELNVLTEMASPLKDAADTHRARNRSQTPPIFRKFATASTIALFLMMAFFGGNQLFLPQGEGVEPVIYKTAVGSYRKVLLDDGTLLELNTDSVVEVDYTPSRRKVRLLNGEAFFQVAHNKNRPFIVYAGKKAVRAVGTAFAVSLLPKSFEVTVTEGKIELTSIEKPVMSEQTQINESVMPKKMADNKLKDDSIYLSAGESIVYDPKTEVLPNVELVDRVSQREIMRKLSWQDGLLDFSETPLIEVIEDLSRYTTMKIEIEDPELRSLKFGGLFRTNELQALFDALEMTFDIRVEKINQQHVRLSRIRRIGS